MVLLGLTRMLRMLHKFHPSDLSSGFTFCGTPMPTDAIKYSFFPVNLLAVSSMHILCHQSLKRADGSFPLPLTTIKLFKEQLCKAMLPQPQALRPSYTGFESPTFSFFSVHLYMLCPLPVTSHLPSHRVRLCAHCRTTSVYSQCILHLILF